METITADVMDGASVRDMNNFDITGYIMTNSSVREIRENLYQFELRLREVKNSCKTTDCCIEVLAATEDEEGDDNSIRCSPVGLKRRTNTAETEISLPISQPDDTSCRLDQIGSYDDDECVIWYADSNLSTSADEDDYKSREIVTISKFANLAYGTPGVPSPLESHFAPGSASDSLPALLSKKASFGGKRKNKGKTKVDGGNNNPKKGNTFFSGGLSFSKKTEFLFRSKKSAAASRKAFSICKVPASIAEEASTTSSATN